MRDAIEKRIDWLYGGTGKPAEKGYMAALEDAVTSNEKSNYFQLKDNGISFGDTRDRF